MFSCNKNYKYQMWKFKTWQKERHKMLVIKMFDLWVTTDIYLLTAFMSATDTANKTQR